VVVHLKAMTFHWMEAAANKNGRASKSATRVQVLFLLRCYLEPPKMLINQSSTVDRRISSSNVSATIPSKLSEDL